MIAATAGMPREVRKEVTAFLVRAVNGAESNVQKLGRTQESTYDRIF